MFLLDSWFIIERVMRLDYWYFYDIQEAIRFTEESIDLFNWFVCQCDTLNNILQEKSASSVDANEYVYSACEHNYLLPRF